MRRLLAVALPIVLLLCAPASAPAKQVTAATVCGDDGCRSIAGAGEGMLQGGPPTDGPARREPFVRLEYRIADGSGHTARVRTIFLPRSGLVLADDGATWMRPLALATLREQARRVAPFAADRLPVSAPVARRSPVAGESTSARWPVSVAAALALALASALAIGAVRVRRARRGGATGAAA